MTGGIDVDIDGLPNGLTQLRPGQVRDGKPQAVERGWVGTRGDPRTLRIGDDWRENGLFEQRRGPVADARGLRVERAGRRDERAVVRADAEVVERGRATA